MVVVRVARAVPERTAQRLGAEEESSPGVRRRGAGLRQAGGLLGRLGQAQRGLPLRFLPLRRRRIPLHYGSPLALAIPRARRARLVPEHARVAPLMPASVDQFPLLALVKGHVTAGACRAASLALQQLPYRRQVCNRNEEFKHCFDYNAC